MNKVIQVALLLACCLAVAVSENYNGQVGTQVRRRRQQEKFGVYLDASETNNGYNGNVRGAVRMDDVDNEWQWVRSLEISNYLSMSMDGTYIEH